MAFNDNWRNYVNKRSSDGTMVLGVYRGITVILRLTLYFYMQYNKTASMYAESKIDSFIS